MRPRAAFEGLTVCAFASLVAAMLLMATGSPARAQSACPGDNGGITLSPGFCATIFADNLGHARQMVFGPNGVLYVNTWSGRYYQYDKPPPGGFLVALKDNTGDGRADEAGCTCYKDTHAIDGQRGL